MKDKTQTIRKMTYHEWKERCLSGARLLRQDAKALESAMWRDASDDVRNCIFRRIREDLKRAMTSRSLIENDDGLEVIQ